MYLSESRKKVAHFVAMFALMNDLRIQLYPNFEEIAANKLLLKIELLIDGTNSVPSDDAFDIHAFIASTRKNGTYFLWTCTCGVPECAGYYYGIQVRIEGRVTHWQDGDFGKNYTFDTASLQQTADTIERALNQWTAYASSRHVKLTIE